jgi:hypothetical protein
MGTRTTVKPDHPTATGNQAIDAEDLMGILPPLTRTFRVAGALDGAYCVVDATSIEGRSRRRRA